MSPKISLTARLDQRLTMNQQLRQAISLLHYNTVELNEIIKQQLETNPLLEVEQLFDEETGEKTDQTYPQENTDYAQFNQQYQSSHYEYKDENYLENYARPISLREHLLEQTLICQFNKKEQQLAEAIIDSLDDAGRLNLSLQEIIEQRGADQLQELPIIQSVLKIIQSFDPPGVAARDLRESLLIQLDMLPNKNQIWHIAKKIIEDHFGMLTPNQIKKTLKILDIDQKTYSVAIELIKTLTLNPGARFSVNHETNIEPELYVKKIKNTWQVFLSESLLTRVKVNNHYQQLLKMSKQHASYQTLNQELQQAQWLIKGLKRRNDTLLAVASHIVELQKDFLDLGPAHLKPMNISEVAYALSIHESTVSRVTTGKYMITPMGVFELKYFFPSHVLTRTGEQCSATAVKEFIKEIISGETHEHIYSDEDIAQALKGKGINIARRTVAKYREALDILPSYQRVSMKREEEIA